MRERSTCFLMTMMLGLAPAALPIPIRADSPAVYEFDQPAQPLGDALRAVAARAGLEIYYEPADVVGLEAPPLQVSLTAEQAIDRLLTGTGLAARVSSKGIVIKGQRRDMSAAADDRADGAIVVTGSRIQGAPPSAPVTTVTEQDIRNGGFSDLGEVARSLPQNFGGGQNPGIGNSQGVLNENSNVNGASTFNLRGIGPNATLTLLNGNRLSYSGISASIDISAIPTAAVERVEVVSDGASAIYGSDAVAGVANIILKRDYAGLATTARIGGSTDGGNFQQQYNATTGSKWAGGGLIVAYDFFKNGAIKAGSRSYTLSANPGSTIYPAIQRHSALASVHQAITPSISLSADLIYKRARNENASGFLLDRPVVDQGVVARTKSESFGIASTISIDLPGRWSAKLAGFYGFDNSNGLTNLYYGGALSSATRRRYDNRTMSIEANAQGPLFDLPAGAVRLAVGAGFRTNRLHAVTSSIDLTRSRNNIYGFGEVYVPLVAPAQGLALIHRASLTAAVRYEDYSDSGSVAVPKVALVYEPIEAISLKASWGRSFKMPTLYQQYSGYVAVLLPASGYGDRFPAGSSYVQLLGATDDQKPERSESWVLSAELKPLRGLQLTTSYFHFDYTDRVAPPVLSAAGALTNPIYADIVTLNPDAARLDTLIGGALGGLQNGTAGPFDPATVVAVLDARDRNIARQIYKGVDVAVRYSMPLADGDAVAISAAATWLESRQRLLPGLPTTRLAGTIFNPPRFKARGGAVLTGPRGSLGAFINYVGGVTDNRRPSASHVRAMTTVDLTGRFKAGAGFEIAISLLNLFNAKPETIYTNSPFDTPFDTTNYSAVGRFIGISVSRNW